MIVCFLTQIVIMLIMLKSKIHHATVTESNLDYVGSIFIDQDLMDKVWIIKFEKVEVINLNTWTRRETYAMPEKKWSWIISVNWWWARLCETGDKIIILAYRVTNQSDLESKQILVDKNVFKKYL